MRQDNEGIKIFTSLQKKVIVLIVYRVFYCFVHQNDHILDQKMSSKSPSYDLA